MSSPLKPIKVWGKEGPDPSKVAIFLLELGIPHETIPNQLHDAKKPGYLVVNPNGRLPAIQDPNTNITFWESGAIIENLIERYDTKGRLNFALGSTESYHEAVAFLSDNGARTLLWPSGLYFPSIFPRLETI